MRTHSFPSSIQPTYCFLFTKGAAFSSTLCYKYRGIHLNHGLSWVAHIKHISKSANQSLGTLRLTHNFFINYFTTSDYSAYILLAPQLYFSTNGKPWKMQDQSIFQLIFFYLCASPWDDLLRDVQLLTDSFKFKGTILLPNL